tara:strand:- start:1913 stop:3019 length:1107 start_codon:yes stop_codon:yes gene_type:complete
MSTFRNIVGDSEADSVLDESGDRGLVEAWSVGGLLDKDDRRRAFQVLYPRRTTDRLLRKAWTVLTALFFLSGVSAIVAANWSELNTFFRLGIMNLLYLGCISIAVYKGVETTTGKIFVSGSAFLVGMLLVILTQEFQFNIEGQWFYGVWCLLSLPLVVVARCLPLWVGWCILLRLLLASMFIHLDDDWQTRGYTLEYRTWLFVAAAALTLLIRNQYLKLWADKADWLRPSWAKFILYAELHALSVGMLVTYFNECWQAICGRSLGQGFHVYRAFLLVVLALGILGVHRRIRKQGIKAVWFLSLSVLAIIMALVFIWCIVLFGHTMPSASDLLLAAIIAFGLFVAGVRYVSIFKETNSVGSLAEGQSNV